MWSDRYILGQTHNPPLLHKIDTWNFGVNDVNDYFEVKRPTSVVIAPGSDIPYCAVHYVSATPGNGDGWPAQAANPGAYVSLLEADQDTDEITWHPILLSHKPVTLMPGFYVPALPMGAYVGDFWDHEHAWPTDAFEYPEVILMESNLEVEMCNYQFTTKAHQAGAAVVYTSPWLITPVGSGRHGSTSNFSFSKLLGVAGENRTGTDQAAVCTFNLHTKSRTYPDVAGNFNYQSLGAITALANNARTNNVVERFSWMKFTLTFNLDVGLTPAGVGYLIV